MCDNNVAINLSKNPVMHSRSKHIKIKHHFIRDYVQRGTFELMFIKIKEQFADLFTKLLPEDRFVQLRLSLGLVLELITE
ncbi:hypothetical protein Fmac_028257 [Flemingia macrophylla]|uniref:Copia protein n=1 Tax=Flemingia macrophylla TaxID=520843 RepID=A0ABD1L6Z7_9FABA